MKLESLCMSASPSSPPSLPPVTVLSGFLGAGKTTLLRHLLAQAKSAGGRRWAAVVNDVASINIDAQLVAQAGARRVVELGNGCVCCSVRDELAETLAELCAGGAYDHVWVETTGVAEPRAIADLFARRNAFGRSLADFARLHALVTVIDARNFLDEALKVGACSPAISGESRSSEDAAAPASHRRQAGSYRRTVVAGAIKPVFELMLDQAECADVLVLNKCDLASEGELEELEKILRGLNPRAEIFRTEQGQLPVEVLLDRPRFDAIATPGAAKWIRVIQSLGGLQPLQSSGFGVWSSELNQLQTPNAKLQTRTHDQPIARHEENYGITSFAYEARRPFARDNFFAWLERGLPAGVLRAKGFFWLAEQPADIGFLSVAGGGVRHEFLGTWAAALRERGVIGENEIPPAARVRWCEPHGDRRQELVFIGIGLDEPALRRALDDCLR